MLRYHSLLLLTVFPTLWQSGAAIWPQPIAEVQLHQNAPQELTASQSDSPIMMIERGDIGHLQVGEYAKIWTSSPIESTSSKMEPRMIAGRVLTATADEVVLSECVGFEGPGAKRGVLLTHKLPYVSRLFKMTDIGLMPTSIAGEIRLPKSSVVGTHSISELEWDSFRQHRHFARISY